MKILTVLVCVHSNNKLHDELLIESLKSLEKQTFKNFETVIVLDECWENTEKKILSEITLDYKLYHKEKKQGLSYAKNYGLSKINTDLVCFLDADDLYLENKLEKQLEYLKNNDVDFLGTHALNRELHNEVFFNSCFNNDKYLTHDEIKNKIFDENIMVHGSMMIKKSALDTLGGYNDVKGMEDWDLWKRAIKSGYKFAQISDRLYVYTLHTSVAR
jgi:glycosyltransferase involved in cell wall biosynthesis